MCTEGRNRRKLLKLPVQRIYYICYKNWENSTLTIKKNQGKVNTSSTSHREFQRRKDKTENKGPRNRNQKRTKEH
jgi:amino acid permease